MNTKVIIFVDLASGNTPRMNLLDFRMCLSNRILILSKFKFW